MNITQRAIQDNRLITQDVNGFGVEITLTAPTDETATVIGIHTKHHNGFDTDGMHVSTKIASIAISEDQLYGYPYRGSNGDVFMRNHSASVMDSTGVVKNYRVIEWYPDEKIGLIVLILADLV